MDDRTVRDMSIEELRSRVEEAEKILRVARQLAQDELRDPESSERAKDRIASLCSDVNALFPGLGEPAASTPDVTAEPAAADDAQDADEAEDAGEGDALDEDESEAGEWDVDYDKLRAALRNPELMGRFPEGQRDEFRAMAEKLLDAHDREETTRAGAEKVRAQLAFALTLEELRSRKRD
jgi:hypothetical protein